MSINDGMKTHYRVLVAVLLVCLSCSAGCATYQKRRALEAVARDWCYTIRASQVLPVYPLTEDIQPGDLFLVQLPIDRQQEAYRERGFLPLDNLIARLRPSGYKQFYENSFGLDTLPKTLVEHDGAGWVKAPTAAFPSYAFSVQSGQGAKVAIPVNGVPVGLSLMNSDAAEGSITLSDVRTYGVDTVSLFQDVTSWQKKNQVFLRNFTPHEKEKGCWYRRGRQHQNYLRVVARVYVTRKVNVALRDSGATSGKVDVGASKTVELLTAKTDDNPGIASAENYAKNLSALNSAIDATLKGADAVAPGGTLKVVSASSRSISMVETFPKPLVLGYLGFDMAILEDGALGPPIPTHAVVAENERPSDRPNTGAYDKDDPSVRCIESRLATDTKSRVEELEQWWARAGLAGRAVLEIKKKAFRKERERFIRDKGIVCNQEGS